MSDLMQDVDWRLEDDLSDYDPDREVYESFAKAAEPGLSAIDEVAADGYEYADDELINHEDPYLQGLLAPAEYD